MFPADKFTYYLKDILKWACLLLVIYLIDSSLYTPIDFDLLGRGISLGDQFVSAIFSGLLPVVVLSFIPPPFGHYSRDIATQKELMGLPVGLAPDSYKEWLVFVLFVMLGAVFEELLFRQVSFQVLYEALHVKGDAILLISAALFAVGHLYQGIKGTLFSFIFGCILGKTYQYTGDLTYPILMHMINNSAACILAFLRIYHLKKLN